MKESKKERKTTRERDGGVSGERERGGAKSVKKNTERQRAPHTSVSGFKKTRAREEKGG